jgi:outer membrane protein assembly factor BamD (BamD/ComL family)
MSVAGLFSSSLFQSLQGTQNNVQTRRSEFQQLGQDLQAGNLTQAQQDFAALTQNASTSTQGTSNSANTISQALSALGQALQSGSLTAAQQDYATVQQDVQQAAGQTQGHHHHHHHGGAQQASAQQSNPISQAFNSLSQALQSGNLSAAQQAYATIQQDFAAFAGGGTTTSQPTTGTLNVNA